MCGCMTDLAGTVEESEDTVTSGSREVSPAGGPTLPILQKIVDLSSKIKVPPFN